jgi:hypothetical protein
MAPFMKTTKTVLFIHKQFTFHVGVIMLRQMGTSYRLYSPTRTLYLLQFSGSK